MSTENTSQNRDAQSLSYRRMVPDARTEIEFYDAGDEWEATQSGNESELVGTGPTKPEAALDYCSKVVDYVNARDGDGDER